MKIAIASDNQFDINEHFGSSRGFVIAEIVKGKIMAKDYRNNSFTNHAINNVKDNYQNHTHHQAGGHSHESILEALKDCEAVISRGMGMRIYNDLRNAGITSIITSEANVDNAIKFYINNTIDNNPDKGCSHHN